MTPLRIGSRRRLHPRWPTVVATIPLLILAAQVGAAQPAPASSPASPGQAPAQPIGEGVRLVDRADEMVLLVVQPSNDGSIGLIVSSYAPACRFPERVFELPIQVNDTGFQLKHAIRPEQERDADGGCTEAIATSYHPEHYWPLKTATAVTLHLPWGPLPLSEDALSHLKRVTPARPADQLPDGGQYISVINRLTAMLSAGQANQAREAAEVLLPAFATRPPAEGFAFFAMLGTARRMTGDLAFAASSFEVSAMLSAMTTTGAPSVGVVYDNLATVRRLQKRWPEAEQASDRAIAALETVDDAQGRQTLAGIYNNRALLLLDQEQYEPALAYSEKALAILKVTLRNQSKALAPFLEDNRKIREKLGQR